MFSFGNLNRITSFNEEEANPSEEFKQGPGASTRGSSGPEDLFDAFLQNIPRFKFYWNSMRNQETLIDKYAEIDEEFAAAFFDHFDADMMQSCWNSITTEN